MFKKLSLTATALYLLASPLSAANASSLENLERERAKLINTLLNPALAPETRLEKIDLSKHRLVDMERMVLRDKTITEANTPEVRIAFQNYDLTFMVHAAIEKDVTLMELWLTQLGLTTNSLMTTQMGRE